MIIEFENEYLKELYTNGKAHSKKYQFQPKVVENYVKVVQRLILATRIESLFVIKSLNYERLRGKLKEFESVRVDKQYRLIIKTRIEGDEPDTITICALHDLTNHYK
jgi:toxin HigB-1